MAEIDKDLVYNSIVDNLKDVYDPEIPINVYDLGLIYDIIINDDGSVHITMSLTSPTCPVGDYITQLVKESAEEVPGVLDVTVELTFEPRWTPERISQEAKEELGLVEENQDNLGLESMFSGGENVSNSNTKEVVGNDKDIEEKVCFNCGIEGDKKPLIPCYYKKDNSYICSSCINKF